MHNLVDVKGHGVLLARRHVDLDHHGIPGHEARGEAAPVLHVPVVESADVLDAVRAPDEQARSLGQVEFREPQAHRQGTRRLNLGPPDPGVLHLQPHAVGQVEVHLEFLSKPPRGALHEVRHSIARTEGLQIDARHAVHRPRRVVHVGAGGVPEGLAAAMRHLGEEGEREQEKGRQARGAKASQGHGVRVQCRQEKDAGWPFRVARWGTKAEFRQASP